MTKIKMKTINGMNENDLLDRVDQLRTDLVKLRTESSKGTLRKESGKVKATRKNIARILTRLNQKQKKEKNKK